MLKRLDPTSRRALLCHVLSGLALAMADTFLQVYIFRLSTGYHAVVEFQIMRSVLGPVGFGLSAWLARRTSTSWAFRAGILLYNLFYLLVLLLGTRCMTFLPVLGGLMGLAMGVYWLGWQVLILDLTHDGQRDAFFGLNSIGAGVVGILGTPLAGWFLGTMPGVEGYRWLFGAASLIFFVAACVSLPLRTPMLPRAGGLIRLFRVARNRDWRRTLVSAFVSGTRDGVLLFLVGVLVYEATNSEIRLGHFTALVSVLSLFGGYLAGHHTRPATRSRNMIFGAVGIAGAVALLVVRVDYVTLLLYGCLTALTAPFFSVPYASLQLKVVADNRRLMHRRADSLILREIPVSLGRIAGGCGLFLVTGANTPTLKALLLAVGLVPLAVYFIVRPILRKGEAAAGRTKRG